MGASSVTPTAGGADGAAAAAAAADRSGDGSRRSTSPPQTNTNLPTPAVLGTGDDAHTTVMLTDAQTSQPIAPPPLLPLAVDLAIQYQPTDAYSADPETQLTVCEPYMCIPTGGSGGHGGGTAGTASDFHPLKIRSSSWLGRAFLTEEPSTFTLPYHSGSKRDGTETAARRLRRLSATPLGGGGGENVRGGDGVDVDYGDDPTVLRQLLQQARIHTDTRDSIGADAGTSEAHNDSEKEDEEEDEGVGGRGQNKSAAGDSDSGGGATTATVLAVPLTLTTPINPVHAANASAGVGVGVGVGTADDDAVAGGKDDEAMLERENTGWRCLGMMLISVRSPDAKDDPTALSESQLVWAAGESIVGAAVHLPPSIFHLPPPTSHLPPHKISLSLLDSMLESHVT